MFLKNIQTGLTLDSGHLIKWGSKLSELSEFYTKHGNGFDFGFLKLSENLCLRIFSNEKTLTKFFWWYWVKKRRSTAFRNTKSRIRRPKWLLKWRLGNKCTLENWAKQFRNKNNRLSGWPFLYLASNKKIIEFKLWHKLKFPVK